MYIYIYIYIRRPLPSLGLGGAAPGITVGVRHGPVLALPWYLCIRPHGTFWAGLKTLKPSQQLSTAPAPPNPPQQPSLAPQAYWASKLPRGTFWAGLKTFKSLAAAVEGLSTAQPSAAALEASCWLCHGASMCLSIGPISCFYWASKLPRGTFWAGLTIFKSFAAAFAGFSTAQPSAAALEASCSVSIGLRNCRVARFGQALKPSKASQQLSKASAPHNPPQQLSKCAAGFAMVPPYGIGPKSCFYWAKSCFYWASKLPRVTF